MIGFYLMVLLNMSAAHTATDTDMPMCGVNVVCEDPCAGPSLTDDCVENGRGC